MRGKILLLLGIAIVGVVNAKFVDFFLAIDRWLDAKWRDITENA